MTGDWRSMASLCGVFTESFARRCSDVDKLTKFLGSIGEKGGGGGGEGNEPLTGWGGGGGFRAHIPLRFLPISQLFEIWGASCSFLRPFRGCHDKMILITTTVMASASALRVPL